MKKSILLTACLVVSAGILFLMTLSATPAAESTNSNSKEQQSDLVVQIPVKPGFEGTAYQAAIPGFELCRVKLRPKQTKTRVCFGMKFTSRKILSANVEVELLDKNGKVLCRTTHKEALGPEKVVSERISSCQCIRMWNDFRAIWLDFPKEADKATAVRLRVELYREPEYTDF